jgi:polar amino acid transport system substrate-binding protein
VIPPYTYRQLSQQKGIIVEIVKAMADLTGHSGQVTFLPWKRALQQVQSANDKPKMIIPLNRSPERENKFTWIQELYVDQTVLVTHTGAHPKITDPTSATELKTGVLLGSPLEAQLKRLKFKNIDSAVNEETNARKLKFGRIDAWLVARLVAPFVFERQGFSPKELTYGASLDANDLYLGGSKNFPPEIAKKWQQAFAKIKSDGTLRSILEKYLN